MLHENKSFPFLLENGTISVKSVELREGVQERGVPVYIVVTYIGVYGEPSYIGKTYNETRIRVKPNQTKLSDNEDVVTKVLENQKEITEIYSELTYPELKGIDTHLVHAQEQS